MGGNPAAAAHATCIILAALILTLASCRRAPPPQPAAKLLVLIAVDQLRADLLDRYDPLFTGGFRRLRDEGFRFTSAQVDHAVTRSAPGLVTLATGLIPARHGIVDAEFYEGPPGQRRRIVALQDASERILGQDGEVGVSARRIQGSTLAEWVLEAHPSARAVVLGSGAHAGAFLAGQFRGDVYWYSIPMGRYVTSTFYRRDYPDWLERFHQDTLPGAKAESNPWIEQVPEKGKEMAFPDMMTFEADGVHMTFPHRREELGGREPAEDPALEVRASSRWLAATPFLDGATLALARQAIAALSLGQRGATDVVLVELAQADVIGRRYGPFSLEQLDNLLRLDRHLGEFFRELDERVGEGRYLVALSAPHGVSNVPEHERERGRVGRRLAAAEIRDSLESAERAALRPGGPPETIASRLALELNRLDFIAEAMPPEVLSGDSRTCDPFTALYRSSYRLDRVPVFPFDSETTRHPAAHGVVVRLTRTTLVGAGAAGSGSPYEYDRRVPLLFMGPGVPRGMSDQRARTVDVAPTLAWLAGVAVPPHLDGRVLRESLVASPSVQTSSESP